MTCAVRGDVWQRTTSESARVRARARNARELMPGVKPRYTGGESAGRAGPGGVCVMAVAGSIAVSSSAVRIERITQYTGRKRERARIPGPASVNIAAAQTLRT